MASKRTFKRNVQREQLRLYNILADANDSVTSESLGHVQMEVSKDNLNFDNSVNNFPQNETQSLRQKLQNWYMEYPPSVKSCSSLLKILKSENMDVPTSVGGLVKRNSKCTVRTVAPGEYIHIEIENPLLKLKYTLVQLSTNTILLDIGIDGILLYKSSSIGLWPILGTIVHSLEIVFLIGTYIGVSKPANINTFLHDMVDEMKVLSNGFLVDGNCSVTVCCSIRAFIHSRKVFCLWYERP